MFELLFFLAITVLAYIYAGYPIVLALLAQTFGRDVDRDSATPTVTIVLAAHQEASVIQQKLENFDQLDYPAERLKMLVVSDASTDGTDEIVKRIRKNFELTPSGIIDALKLRRPIYRQTAAYGHFGRQESTFSWEKTDKARALRRR